MEETPQAPTQNPPVRTETSPRPESPPLTPDPRLINILKKSFWGSPEPAGEISENGG